MPEIVSSGETACGHRYSVIKYGDIRDWERKTVIYLQVGRSSPFFGEHHGVYNGHRTGGYYADYSGRMPANIVGLYLDGTWAIGFPFSGSSVSQFDIDYASEHLRKLEHRLGCKPVHKPMAEVEFLKSLAEMNKG